MCICHEAVSDTACCMHKMRLQVFAIVYEEQAEKEAAKTQQQADKDIAKVCMSLAIACAVCGVPLYSYVDYHYRYIMERKSIVSANCCSSLQAMQFMW